MSDSDIIYMFVVLAVIVPPLLWMMWNNRDP